VFRLPEWRRVFRLPNPNPDAASGEIDGELEFHLEMRVAELVAGGMPEPEARVEARRRFGDLADARETLTHGAREQARLNRVTTAVADFGRDLQHAGRGLRRRPGLTAVAIGILALGIGLTTAVLTVVNRLILNPLPYSAADRLAVVLLASESTAMQLSPTLRLLEIWRQSPAPVDWLEATNSEELLLEDGETAELVQTRAVTPGLLPALGAPLVAGRGLTRADAVPGAPPVALLAWGAWQGRFGGADMVGRSIRINGELATVVGVLGRGFDLTAIDGRGKTEIWLPIRTGPAEGDRSVVVLLRRRPGALAGSITNDLRAATVAAGLKSEMLDKFKPTVQRPEVLSDSGRARSLWLLAIAAALVLAVACANVAALMLGQAAARAQEFGIRAALGAGRGRVSRQLVTESVFLGGLGGIGGLIVAAAALAVTRAVRPGSLLMVDEIGLDWSMLATAVGVALVATLGFGTAPLWAVSRQDGAAALVGRLRQSFDTRFGRSFRGGLVVGQLALSVVLLVGAGGLLRAFLRERSIPTGFDARGLAWISTEVPARYAPTAALMKPVAEGILEAARGVPGVTAAAIAGDPPIGYGLMEGTFLIEGRPVPAQPTKILIPIRTVTPAYFATIGMPVQGRTFSEDSNRTEIIIDTATARRFWPNGGAIGSRVRFDQEGVDQWRTIVGVVPESRAWLGAFEDAPFVYTAEVDRYGPTLLVRVADPDRLGAVSQAIRQADSRVKIRNVTAAESALDALLASRRFATTIVIGFAGLGLLLAAVGLYGVVALAVNQRTYEFGVRIALGAAPASVLAMVLRQGAGRVAAGLVVGIILAGAGGELARRVTALLPAADPLVFLVAGSILGGTGILACWLPARRASRVDPLVALRSD
jgi:predicted permease